VLLYALLTVYQIKIYNMFVMRNTAKDCVLLSAVSSVRAVSGYIAANTVPRRTENNCISGKEIFENT